MPSDEIEKYIDKLVKEELDFKRNISLNKKEGSYNTKNLICYYLKISKVILVSIKDFLCLKILLLFNSSFFSDKHIVYTAKNFCTIDDNGNLEDRILKPIIKGNIIFINYGKEYIIKKINGENVFNIGGFVKIKSFFLSRKLSARMRVFKAYQDTNDKILKNFRNNFVYTFCFYDLNGLSLSFSLRRKNISLVEVQHGAIINYPPYKEPSPIKIADVFYVKNKETIEYVKNNLNKNFSAIYKLIPYPKSNSSYKDGTHILYASTVEFNGFHPVFVKFLESNKLNNLIVKVRLHPRERENENVFRKVLEKYNIVFEFDESKNWIESNTIKNLIVISPWSSVIEDSFDNDYKTIVIDEVGQKRFKHLIDNKKCYYSNDIAKTLKLITC